MRPTYWRPWTRYIPLPLLLVLSLALCPLYLAVGAYDGCCEALRGWRTDVASIWQALWSEH